jgi:hypothetical protein
VRGQLVVQQVGHVQVDQLREAQRLQDLLHLGQRGPEFLARERNPEVAAGAAGARHVSGASAACSLTWVRLISKMRMPGACA